MAKRRATLRVDVDEAAKRLIALMGDDIRKGRLDIWLKPEELDALRSLERAVRRAPKA